MFEDYAARGRAFKDAVGRLSDERQEEIEAMSATLPVPRADVRSARPPAKQRTGTLKRERHQADYTILVASSPSIAIGILMVYSSSAMKAYLEDDDTLGHRRSADRLGRPGLAAMATMMRVDYRYLRMISVPVYIVAVVLLVLVFVPSLNIVVGGSARWLKIGPLPAIHPAEIAKLAMVIYLAHWFAKRGTKVTGFWSGTIPFLIITAPILALVFREPDLGTTMVLGLTAVTMFFLAGREPGRTSRRWRCSPPSRSSPRACAATRSSGSRPGSTRGQTRSGTGFHTIQGLLALGLGGILGAGLGESRLAGGLFLPNASNDYIFAIIGEEFGLIGAAIVIGLFVVLAYSGIRVALAAPDTFGALLAAGITAWLCIQAFINIGVVVALIPVTGITLPFISAGGLVAHHQPRGGRHPAVDLARDRRTRNLERCAC